MKKFLINLLIYIIVILGICEAVQYVIDSGLQKYNNNLYCNWNRLFKGEINSDIIILGSSRAFVNYDPKVIEGITGHSCYNLGVNGGKMVMQSAKFESYIAHNTPPKVILQNIEIMYLRKEDYLYKKEQFLPYLSSSTVSPYLSLVDKNIWFEKLIPLSKYRGLRSTVFLGLKSFLGLSKKPKYNEYKGFLAQKRKWNNDFDKYLSRHKKLVYKKGELDFGFKVLKELIKQCKELNIKLILVHAPMYYELQQIIPQKDSVDNLFTEMAHKNGIQFWDYSKDTLSYSTKYFYNSMHLNYTGAEIFSQTLAQRLENYFMNKENQTVSIK